MRTRGYLFKRINGTVAKKNSAVQGVFYLTWKWRDQAGKESRRTISLHTRDKIEAERRRAALCGGIVTDSDEEQYLRSLVEIGEAAKLKLGRLAAAGKDILLSDAWNQYLQSRRRPPSGDRTLQGYQGQLSRFVKWAKAARAVQDVNGAIAEQYVTDLEHSGLNAGTVRKHIMLLKLVWRILLPNSPNPWSGLRPSTVHERTPHRRLTTEEVKAIISKSSGEWRTLIVIGYTTGLRLYDAVHLSWDAIDRSGQYITVRPKKTERRKPMPITVPIVKDLENELKEIRSTRKGGYILPGIVTIYEHDAPRVTKLISRLFKAAGVLGTTEGTASFHSLRVCYRSNCDAAGVSASIIRSILGHADEETSRLYSKPAMEEKRKAANRAIKPLNKQGAE